MFVRMDGEPPGLSDLKPEGKQIEVNYRGQRVGLCEEYDAPTGEKYLKVWYDDGRPPRWEIWEPPREEPERPPEKRVMITRPGVIHSPKPSSLAPACPKAIERAIEMKVPAAEETEVQAAEKGGDNDDLSLPTFEQV